MHLADSPDAANRLHRSFAAKNAAQDDTGRGLHKFNNPALALAFVRQALPEFLARVLGEFMAGP